MAAAARAKVALSVRRNWEPNGHRPQMRDFAKKLHRRLWVSIFQFSICRTHAAKGGKAAAYAFGDTLPCASPYAKEELLPTLLYTARPDVIGVLMRKHTNTHVPVWVNGKGVHAATARVRRLDILQSGRMLHLFFAQFSILGCYFRSI